MYSALCNHDRHCPRARRHCPRARRRCPQARRHCPRARRRCPRHDDVVHGHDDVVHGHDDIVHGHDDVVHGHDDIVHGHDDVVHGHDDVVHGTMTLLCLHRKILSSTTPINLLLYVVVEELPRKDAPTRVILRPVVQIFVNVSLELVDVLGYNRCLREYIPVVYYPLVE